MQLALGTDISTSIWPSTGCGLASAVGLNTINYGHNEGDSFRFVVLFATALRRERFCSDERLVINGLVNKFASPTDRYQLKPSVAHSSGSGAGPDDAGR